MTQTLLSSFTVAFLLTLPFVRKSGERPPLCCHERFLQSGYSPWGSGMCCAGWGAPSPLPDPRGGTPQPFSVPSSPLKNSSKTQTRFFLLQFRTAASCSVHQTLINPFSLSAALVHIYRLLPCLCSPLSFPFCTPRGPPASPSHPHRCHGFRPALSTGERLLECDGGDGEGLSLNWQVGYGTILAVIYTISSTSGFTALVNAPSWGGLTGTCDNLGSAIATGAGNMLHEELLSPVLLLAGRRGHPAALSLRRVPPGPGGREARVQGSPRPERSTLPRVVERATAVRGVGDAASSFGGDRLTLRR